MTVDGVVTNGTAVWVSLAAFATAVTLVESKRNPRPPLGRYRRDGKFPWVATWNLFSETTFTPEAIRYHRRLVLAIPVYFSLLALGWLLLDYLW